MIDRLRSFAQRVLWLKPFFYFTTAAAFLIFGYVVLIEEGAEKDVYLIPSIIGALWSLVCSLLLSIFPFIPPKPDRHIHRLGRLKTTLMRGTYHIVSWLLLFLSAAVLWLTIKLIGVWLADF